MNLLALPWNIIVCAAKIVCNSPQIEQDAFMEGYLIGQQNLFDQMAEYTHLEPQDGEQHSSPLHHGR